MARVVIEISDLPNGDLAVNATAYATAIDQDETDVLASWSARVGQAVLNSMDALGEVVGINRLCVRLLDHCPDGCDCTARCGDDPRLRRDEYGRKVLLPEAGEARRG